MKDLGFTYMVAAYFAVWIVLLGYVLFLGLRMAKIQKDVQHLAEVVKKKSK